MGALNASGIIVANALLLIFSPLFFLEIFVSFVCFRCQVHIMKGKNDDGLGY